MGKLSILSASLFLSFNLFASGDEQYQITKRPQWVEPVELGKDRITLDNNGYYYLLADRQSNTVTSSHYYQFAIKVYNSEGIQNMSNISINFDPSFQRLNIHEVSIIRNGLPIDKIKTDPIEIIQRETSMDRHLYDGSLTATINITDVRVDDIILYSYTIEGSNPAYKGIYGGFSFNFTLPISKLFTKLIFEQKDSLILKEFNNPDKPKVKYSNATTSYEWIHEDVKPVIYDNNTPSWYDPHPSVKYTNYTSWKAFALESLSNFQVSGEELKNLKKKIGERFDSGNKAISIEQAIRFVQDEVRYLGLENGMSAYKPHLPVKVFDQRFGDCKDKSLLLVCLLNLMDVEANPVLVSSSQGLKLENSPPSPDIFDHCIVRFSYEDKDYYIDPTISGQGGDLNNLSTPNYHYGLNLRKETESLTELPKYKIQPVLVEETLTLDDAGFGDATFSVRTTYKGLSADNQRSYFSRNSINEITKQYLDFYSNLYPSIKSLDGVKLIDEKRNTDNELVIDESYLISNIWKKSSDNENLSSLELYPLGFESYVNINGSSIRTMPFYLGKAKYEHKILVNLPESWQFEEITYAKKDSSYNYSLNGTYNSRKKQIELVYSYESKKDDLSPTQFVDFIITHEDIMNNISYFLTYDSSIAKYKLSYLSIILGVIIFSIGCFASFKVYSSYNPDIEITNPKNLAIGGWLILPAIGLCFTPVRMAFELVNSDNFYDANFWYSHFLNKDFKLLALITFEFLYNFLFTAFSLLVVVLFFQKRTSAPLMIKILYAISLVITLVDNFFANQLVAGVQIDFKSIFQSAVAAAIWIPYFSNSNRVKNTFTVRLDSTLSEQKNS
ncbi:DUF3857 domain-containing protein [Fulvivirga sp.]|uniref:DUF3857 domain-containing protein n=1 Tax=Fulvivirga sp. TaxID=1931237 RepID=UPI0032EE53C2